MENLKSVLRSHERLKFPEFPEDDDFADWVGELAEADGYYVGIAMSVVAGCKNVELDSSHIRVLCDSLDQFSGLKFDNQVYLECQKYLKSLNDCVEHMKPWN